MMRPRCSTLTSLVSYQMIDDIPQAEIATAATDYPGEYFNVGQLGTYYVCFNVNSVAFNKVANTEPKRELRSQWLKLAHQPQLHRQLDHPRRTTAG